MSNWSSKNKAEFEKIYKSIDNIKSRMPEFLEDFLLGVGRTALRKTKQRTPVLTGRLKRSWKLSKVEVEGKQFMVYLTNDAKDNGQPYSYASFVEYGAMNSSRTKFRPGVFMATISIKEVERTMPIKFKTEFRKWLKENGL